MKVQEGTGTKDANAVICFVHGMGWDAGDRGASKSLYDICIFTKLSEPKLYNYIVCVCGCK